MIKVAAVAPDSIGAELGIEPGTELVAVNGRPLLDFLDWEFLTADHQFELEARFPRGEPVVFDIERPEGFPMGIELEPPRIRRCGNRCDFCFVDGLPQGLRETLYIRDDDYRLSFRHGNFATLTNLKEQDVRRILEYRLSPLYVSVHATDPMVRRRLLRNPLAPDVMEQLTMFSRGGVRFHTQIVLQPGVNDGAVLHRSLEDLYSLGDAVLSVSVVPVGLTEFSKHDLVREPTRDECRDAVTLVERFAERALAERRHRWAHGSDELYAVAELALPPAESYGEFEQMENGVGSVRFLETRITEAGPRMASLRNKQLGVATGTAMGRLMPMVLPQLEQHTGGALELIVLENHLFGPRVTTAGLLPGAAFRDALQSRNDLDIVLLPAEALNDDNRFIDDMPFAELAEAVPAEIRCSYDFADVLAGDSR
jgi:putative radical SAM enzyme (TIGR03279 family)